MSERGIELKIRINFPVILFTMLALHALFLAGVKNMNQFASSSSNSRSNRNQNNRDQNRTPLRIRDIRSVGSRNSKKKDSVYLAKTNSKTQKISDEKFSPTVSQSQNTFRPMNAQPMSPQPMGAPKKPLSLSDLTDNKPVVVKKQKRPGTRPEVAKTAVEQAKTMSGIKLKGGQEIQKFAQSAATLSGDPRAESLSNSDILVNIEVPEGVNPDELNKYELMFYGFQRRTAIGYVNSFYKHLDKFQRENPHKQFPLTDSKQVMTGRLTYDSQGNIVQIKMVRWSEVEQLQDFFVEVLKDMDTLHNPPQALWEKNGGEFSIYFSLVING